MKTTVPAVAIAHSFEQKLAAAGAALEPELQKLLPKEGRLAEAMRYAVLGSGKRFRPFLVLESAELFGAPKSSALSVAAAIECLHCYSLVHDDLPAMDDDDMRRGKPSAHKKFGEASAILAGDALQTLAFEIMAQKETHSDANVRAELIRGLAQASGFAGMAGGQQLDMEAEHAAFTLEDVRKIQQLKTGALISFSAEAGAIVAGAPRDGRRAIKMYAEKLGLAYDIADQLADAEEDAAAGKASIVPLIGKERAQELLHKTVTEAEQGLEMFGTRADTFREAAQFLLRPFK